MIQFVRGTVNVMPVTLKEKQTLTNPYWLIRFVSDNYNTSNTCIAADSNSSDVQNRWNKLSVTESTTENRTSGTLTLADGVWTYYVYEQSSSSNLIYTNAGNLCEVGQVMVLRSTTEQQISQPNYDTTYSWTTQ